MAEPAAPQPSAERVLRVGVIGLSRAFVLMRQAFADEPRVRLVAAADPRPEARAAFEADHGGRTFADAEGLCASAEVDAVYVASPHGLHADHVLAALRAGKAVLVEKPMALTLADCERMVAAAQASGAPLVVGPSHGYDPPVVAAATRIAAGADGPVRMVTALAFTDFLYRPRTAEELDTAKGGGVLFSQAVHQIDIVRRLIGRPCRAARAVAGAWDAARPTQGAYQALLTFEGGASATLTYSGYARFDSDALMDGSGEMGRPSEPGRHTRTRAVLQSSDEAALKRDRAYSAPLGPPPPLAPGHEHLGLVIASCERADLRLTPSGFEVHGDAGVEQLVVPRRRSMQGEALAALWRAAVLGEAPVHDGRWGRDTLAVALAMLRSSEEGREVSMEEITP